MIHREEEEGEEEKKRELYDFYRYILDACNFFLSWKK